MNKIRLILIICFWFVLSGPATLHAQIRQADSLRKKQELFNQQQKAKAQKDKDSIMLARYKANNPAVVSYDSKGNKIEHKKERDGTTVITTTIKQPPVLNRKFSVDTLILDSIYIKVFKSKYRLQVYHKGKVLTAYKCVFGPNCADQKLQEGDRRTPEGTFTILDIKNHDKWDKFMLLDYPNETSRRNHEEAKQKGLIPSHARIGGSVGIHGIWNNGDNVIDLKHNWTDGCIALKNKDVEELSRIIKPGYTTITILK